ncbi:MAG: hypothetical protein KAT17_09065 [Candidatus Aminicenantes bacterium]|nr:hypothetical protein [Candidatus Aminicenantes bacterium]
MRRIIFTSLLMLLIISPGFSIQSDEDIEISRTRDYTDAILKKTPEKKIAAFKAYIKKYPDTSQKFTKLAYYMLTVNYFHNKNYQQTIQYGKKTLKLGELPSRGEQARLYLIIGNAYGIKNTSFYNKDQALHHTNKAISLARGHDSEVLKTAQDLKKKITAPPAKKLTPEQKIKVLVYQDEDYKGAISYYRSLGTADKENDVIHETYATALMKANRLDSALKEFNKIYTKNKKAVIAKNIAESYSKKAKSNKSYYNKSVDYYIESSLLFKKEANYSNSRAALKLAKFQLFEKYDFNSKIKRYNAKQQKNKSSKTKTEAEIARLERELRKHKRHLRKTYEYNDLDPPAYELDKTERLEKKISSLKSGGSAEDDAEGQRLLQERKKIEKEFDGRVIEIKKRL